MRTLNSKYYFNILVVTALWLLTSSCNHNEIPTKQSGKHITIGTPTERLSEDDATLQAINIYGAIFHGSMRSISTPPVTNIKYISKSTGRSTSGKPIYGAYIVSFGDKQGYVVLSENPKSKHPILMACSQGNLDLKHPHETPALQPIEEGINFLLEKDNEQDPDDGTHFRDSTGNIVNPGRYYSEYGPWEVIEQHGPLLSINLGQNSPYNARLTPIEGKLPPTGCAATAVAGIMSFYKHPQFNWDLITEQPRGTYAASVLPQLFLDLGRPHNLDMKYGPKVSGAFSINACEPYNIMDINVRD